MMYRYYLDSVLLTDEPMGWDGITNKIERVDEIKGLFVTVDVTLTFRGAAFATLIQSYGDSFCNTHTILIQESCDDGITWYDVHDGIIFISDCTFDYNNCLVEAKVQDNSFYAKINNNKSVKALLEIGKSKNGVAYTGAADYQIEIFDVCTAAYIAGPRYPHSVRIYEAFRCLVAFMTDDTVDFDSTFFDVGGDGEGYCITDGLHLSGTLASQYSVTTLLQKVCFIDLFNEMDKRFNLGMMIDNSGARPKLIIEEASYFRNIESVVSMSRISGLKASVDVDSLYSQVRFGCETAIGNGCAVPGALGFPEDTVFYTFKEETYYIIGTCNVDKTLDLYGQWISDTNIIQDCVTNASEDYDDRIFIIWTAYVNANSGQCIEGNPFNDPAAFPRYYNQALMNYNVAPRFLGAVPNSIAEQLANINDEFWAHKSVPFVLTGNWLAPVGLDPIPYNDDTTPPYNDAGGNFTLGTGRYTATATGGNYRFFHWLWYYINGINANPLTKINFTNSLSSECTILITTRTVHHDGVNVVFADEKKRKFTNYLPYINSGAASKYNFGITTYSFLSSHMYTLSVGDYVYSNVEVELIGLGWSSGDEAEIVFTQSDFKTAYTSNGGGQLATYDPEEYPAFKYEFEYPLTTNEFQALIDQPNYAVTLDVDGENTFKAFIKQATYKRKTGMAQFTCIASKSMDE